MSYEHGANSKSIARKSHLDPCLLTDYSANINPHIEPQWLRQIYEEAFKCQFTYPDIDYDELKRAVCDYEKIPMSTITLGNGASPLFFDLVHHLPIQKATLFHPTFNEYEQALRANHAKIHEIVSFDYAATLKELPFQEAIFLCNPNNPTGKLTPKAAILEYARTYPKAKIILDESFMDFTDKKESCLNEVEAYPHIYVIKSYTKMFKCPGLRIGALFTSHQQLNENLKLKTPPWSVNCIIEAILPHYLKDEQFIQETRELVALENQYLHQNLEALGFVPLPSSTNFILFQADFDLAQVCLKQHIVIRDCANFKGMNPYTYRICVSQREKNEQLIIALKAAINHKSNDL